MSVVDVMRARLSRASELGVPSREFLAHEIDESEPEAPEPAKDEPADMLALLRKSLEKGGKGAARGGARAANRNAQSGKKRAAAPKKKATPSRRAA